jgi:hypothetical protein
MLTALTTAVLLHALTPSATDPAAFRVNLDISRNVDVVLHIEGKEIEPGMLYQVNGLPGRARLAGEAVFYHYGAYGCETRRCAFEVPLTPGYLSIVNLKIRAQAGPVHTC